MSGFIYEPTPELTSFSCKAFAYTLMVGLYSIPFVLGLLGWNFYGGFVAFGFFCFGYLLSGVIQSKLRLLSIPFDQLENTYSTKELSFWFVARYKMCK